MLPFAAPADAMPVACACGGGGGTAPPVDPKPNEHQALAPVPEAAPPPTVQPAPPPPVDPKPQEHQALRPVEPEPAPARHRHLAPRRSRRRSTPSRRSTRRCGPSSRSRRRHRRQGPRRSPYRQSTRSRRSTRRCGPSSRSRRRPSPGPAPEPPPIDPKPQEHQALRPVEPEPAPAPPIDPKPQEHQALRPEPAPSPSPGPAPEPPSTPSRRSTKRCGRSTRSRSPPPRSTPSRRSTKRCGRSSRSPPHAPDRPQAAGAPSAAAGRAGAGARTPPIDPKPNEHQALRPPELAPPPVPVDPKPNEHLGLAPEAPPATGPSLGHPELPVVDPKPGEHQALRPPEFDDEPLPPGVTVEEPVEVAPLSPDNYFEPWTRVDMTEEEWRELEDEVLSEACPDGWERTVFGCSVAGLTLDEEGQLEPIEILESGVGSAIGRLARWVTRAKPLPSVGQALGSVTARLPLSVKNSLVSRGLIQSPASSPAHLCRRQDDRRRRLRLRGGHAHQRPCRPRPRHPHGHTGLQRLLPDPRRGSRRRRDDPARDPAGHRLHQPGRPLRGHLHANDPARAAGRLRAPGSWIDGPRLRLQGERLKDALRARVRPRPRRRDTLGGEGRPSSRSKTSSAGSTCSSGAAARASRSSSNSWSPRPAVSGSGSAGTRASRRSTAPTEIRRTTSAPGNGSDEDELVFYYQGTWTEFAPGVRRARGGRTGGHGELLRHARAPGRDRLDRDLTGSPPTRFHRIADPECHSTTSSS